MKAKCYPKRAIMKAVQLVFSWGQQRQVGTEGYCQAP